MSDAEITLLKTNMTNEERLQFDVQYAGVQKEPGVALILSLFFGLFGIDRFYIESIGVGVFKLLTFGGLVIFALIDLFLIMGAARRKNLAVAKEIHQGLMQLRERG